MTSRKYNVKPADSSFRFDRSKLQKIKSKVPKIKGYRPNKADSASVWLDEGNASLTLPATGYAIWEWQEDPTSGGNWVLVHNSCGGTPPTPDDLADDNMPLGLQIIVDC